MIRLYFYINHRLILPVSVFQYHIVQVPQPCSSLSVALLILVSLGFSVQFYISLWNASKMFFSIFIDYIHQVWENFCDNKRYLAIHFCFLESLLISLLYKFYKLPYNFCLKTFSLLLYHFLSFLLMNWKAVDFFIWLMTIWIILKHFACRLFFLKDDHIIVK